MEGVTTLGPTNMNKIEAALASLSAPAPSTTPPATPADGDIWYLPADASNGVTWQFRYNASGATYKWEFVGGPALFAAVETVQSTTSASYVDLATVGPSLTVPRSGDFIVRVVLYLDTAASSNSGVGVSIAGAAATDLVYLQGTAAACDTGSEQKFSSLTAGNTIKMQYKSNGTATNNFGRRRLFLTPVRVS